MRLIADDDGIDLVAANERAQLWESVRFGMKSGLITPENFTPEDRQGVREFYAQLPVVEAVDPRLGTARIIAVVDLREGRDWCFATSRNGAFGVFSLDEPSRTFLEGATFHLWVADPMDPSAEQREDFSDLPTYMDEAMEASLAFTLAA